MWVYRDFKNGAGFRVCFRDRNLVHSWGKILTFKKKELTLLLTWHWSEWALGFYRSQGFGLAIGPFGFAMIACPCPPRIEHLYGKRTHT